MKCKISRMDPFSIKIDDLKRVMQELWNEMNPSKFIHEIDSMSGKCEEMWRKKEGKKRRRKEGKKENTIRKTQQ